MVRTLFLSVALSVAAGTAGAQIVTYVPEPRPAAPTPAMVAAADSARADSVANVAMTNMKQWVDSAAGIAVPSYVGDSIPADDPGRPVPTTFVDGSVAPATASDLPTLGVAGLVAFVAGLVLLAGRPRG